MPVAADATWKTRSMTKIRFATKVRTRSVEYVAENLEGLPTFF